MSPQVDMSNWPRCPDCGQTRCVRGDVCGGKKKPPSPPDAPLCAEDRLFTLLLIHEIRAREAGREALAKALWAAMVESTAYVSKELRSSLLETLERVDPEGFEAAVRKKADGA